MHLLSDKQYFGLTAAPESIPTKWNVNTIYTFQSAHWRNGSCVFFFPRFIHSFVIELRLYVMCPFKVFESMEFVSFFLFVRSCIFFFFLLRFENPLNIILLLRIRRFTGDILSITSFSPFSNTNNYHASNDTKITSNKSITPFSLH